MNLYQEIQAKAPAELAKGNYHLVAAKVNVGRVKTVKTPIQDVQAYLQTNGIWWAIKGAAADNAHPQTQAAAIAVIDTANARYENLDMSLPIINQMFSALTAAGVLTADQKDFLLAMGTEPNPVTWQDCYAAVSAVTGA